ncbi:MAG: polymer-forming cytoskeletal protein [Lachnospiraceae bacterium]|nr:polymer-forming cytoskeletal protein [Lachnospiraceae bacterium]
MGFFKEFKDDLSEAVDEIFPGDTIEGESAAKAGSKAAAEKLDTDLDVDTEFSKLDGLLEKVPAGQGVRGAGKSAGTKEGSMDSTKEIKANDNNKAPSGPDLPKFDAEPASDENAVITSGMTIKGDLESTGSIEVDGTINGNVRCNGKLTVMGVINGNSTSSEFFADNAKVEGEVSTSGTVKIGVGSVIIGNITASSAVIAGAVKGNIDVGGPVVVDTSAVVMGDIKSRSVQINNGAVIQGFCSQTYAEVDMESVFA